MVHESLGILKVTKEIFSDTVLVKFIVETNRLSPSSTTVGRNKEAIKKYIANQLQEDKLAEQLSMKEYIDPFTGEPTKESK